MKVVRLNPKKSANRRANIAEHVSLINHSNDIRRILHESSEAFLRPHQPTVRSVTVAGVAEIDQHTANRFIMTLIAQDQVEPPGATVPYLQASLDSTRLRAHGRNDPLQRLPIAWDDLIQ